MKRRHLMLIRTILTNEMNKGECSVYLFGSRARGSAKPSSDIDLAVESTEEQSRPIARTRAAFEDSHLPYKVDLVDLKHAPRDLQEEVKTVGKLIWKR